MEHSSFQAFGVGAGWFHGFIPKSRYVCSNGLFTADEIVENTPAREGSIPSRRSGFHKGRTYGE